MYWLVDFDLLPTNRSDYKCCCEFMSITHWIWTFTDAIVMLSLFFRFPIKLNCAYAGTYSFLCCLYVDRFRKWIKVGCPNHDVAVNIRKESKRSLPLPLHIQVGMGRYTVHVETVIVVNCWQERLCNGILTNGESYLLTPHGYTMGRGLRPASVPPMKVQVATQRKRWSTWFMIYLVEAVNVM
jgi:hypothetical protein